MNTTKPECKVTSTSVFGLRRRAIKNFPRVSHADLHKVKDLRRKWISSVLRLGDNWLLLKKVERKVL